MNIQPSTCYSGVARLSWLVLFLTMATACSSASRPEKTQEQLLAERQTVLQAIAQGRQRFEQKAMRRIISEQTAAAADPSAERGVFDILIISGGGDYGAFGAGVLKGWGTIKDPSLRRPMFDVVTGVSTGSLISPYAFIGTDEAIREIYKLYMNPDPGWVKRRSGLFFLPSRDSLIDPSGLHNAAEQQFTPEMIGAITRGWKEDRQLLVGTTNLDMGFMRIFDLTRVAAKANDTGDRAYFLNVLKASIAIPGAFPPVEIDGHLHVDGGATLSIFLPTSRDLIIQGQSVADRLPPGVGRPKYRIWAIVNNKLVEAPVNTQLSWLDNVARSLSTAIRTSVQVTLRDLETTAALVQKAGHDIEFRYLAIPGEFQIPSGEQLFDPKTMQALGELGIELGSDINNWQTTVLGPEWAVDLFPQPEE